MYRHTMKMAAVSLALLVPLACVDSSVRQSAERPCSEAGKTRIQDKPLRKIMADLEREVTTSWPQEIENEFAMVSSVRTGHALEEACWLADGLAKAAARIPGAAKRIRMNDADRRAFLALARKLHHQAEELETSACGADLAIMRRNLTAIRLTCHACHDQFRGVARLAP